MKKFTLMIALLVVGLSAVAAPKTSAAAGSSYSYGEPFIFVERNVEFAVYQDGQFDFLYNPRGIKASRINPRLNMSYNAGYNYGPYVQYDDFGAVIQIESVPVYYDYYGRIIRAGSVVIDYNSFGRISRIGNLYIHYNPYNQYTHYSGFINGYNHRYTPRPWHQYYRPPFQQYTVVYHQPYRDYYYPTRVKYSYHKNYYKQHYSNDFKRSYYRPGDNVVVYHRGTRAENERNIRDGRDLSTDFSSSDVRSNANSQRDRTSRSRIYDTKASSSTSVRRASDAGVNVRDSRASRTRTETVRTPVAVERAATPVRAKSVEQAPVQRTVRRDTRSSSSQVERTPVQSSVKRPETVIRSSGTTNNSSERSSTSRSSRGRG